MTSSCTQDLVSQLASALLKKQWRLSTAESCTGGLVAAAITELAGSSDWFERGYVTYSNSAKSEDINVSQELIAQHGAVSDQVARAMAIGAKQSSNSDMVNHPSHYGGDSVYEYFKVAEAWDWHKRAYLWNAGKYMCRTGKKSKEKEIEDLEKAIVYLKKEIELLKNGN